MHTQSCISSHMSVHTCTHAHVHSHACIICTHKCTHKRTPAHTSTDFLWEAMAKVAPSSRDDQYKLNYALKAMNISWTVTDTSRSQDKERTGLGEHGLKVTLLPPRMACRGRSCLEQSQSSCYVWHRGQTHHTNDIATKVAKQERVWFLQADWINITTASQSVGVDWLGEIAKDPDLQ